MFSLPLLRPRRRSNQARRVLSHGERRRMLHASSYVAPERVELCRVSIGCASWCPFGGIFGNPSAVLHSMPRYAACVIKFPALC